MKVWTFISETGGMVRETLVFFSRKEAKDRLDAWAKEMNLPTRKSAEMYEFEEGDSGMAKIEECNTPTDGVASQLVDTLETLMLDEGGEPRKHDDGSARVWAQAERALKNAKLVGVRGTNPEAWPIFQVIGRWVTRRTITVRAPDAESARKFVETQVDWDEFRGDCGSELEIGEEPQEIETDTTPDRTVDTSGGN